ncbi:hypothetical protein BGX28_000479 [Mortierella sp. GBA30]|nr:hypothetical protein BGX28_000479 [Mortierella sp. GBA30]
MKRKSDAATASTKRKQKELHEENRDQETTRDVSNAVKETEVFADEHDLIEHASAATLLNLRAAVPVPEASASTSASTSTTTDTIASTATTTTASTTDNTTPDANPTATKRSKRAKSPESVARAALISEREAWSHVDVLRNQLKEAFRKLKEAERRADDKQKQIDDLNRKLEDLKNINRLPPGAHVQIADHKRTKGKKLSEDERRAATHCYYVCKKEQETTKVVSTADPYLRTSYYMGMSQKTVKDCVTDSNREDFRGRYPRVKAGAAAASADPEEAAASQPTKDEVALGATMQRLKAEAQGSTLAPCQNNVLNSPVLAAAVNAPLLQQRDVAVAHQPIKVTLGRRVELVQLPDQGIVNSNNGINTNNGLVSTTTTNGQDDRQFVTVNLPGNNNKDINVPPKVNLRRRGGLDPIKGELTNSKINPKDGLAVVDTYKSNPTVVDLKNVANDAVGNNHLVKVDGTNQGSNLVTVDGTHQGSNLVTTDGANQVGNLVGVDGTGQGNKLVNVNTVKNAANNKPVVTAADVANTAATTAAMTLGNHDPIGGTGMTLKRRLYEMSPGYLSKEPTLVQVSDLDQKNQRRNVLVVDSSKTNSVTKGDTNVDALGVKVISRRNRDDEDDDEDEEDDDEEEMKENQVKGSSVKEEKKKKKDDKGNNNNNHPAGDASAGEKEASKEEMDKNKKNAAAINNSSTKTVAVVGVLLTSFFMWI